MVTPITQLEHQVESAFNFRGNVTITLCAGEVLEGFVTNREFVNPKLAQDQFVDVCLTDGTMRRLMIAEMASVVLSGEDLAAGKSYTEWMAKRQAKGAGAA